MDQFPRVDDRLAGPDDSDRDGPLPPGADAAPSQAGETSFIHPASMPPSACIIALIPIEVRNMIYELLLINPDLGRASHGSRGENRQ
jgi:hypothetical protein